MGSFLKVNQSKILNLIQKLRFSTKPAENVEFAPIYKFRHINIIHAVNKLKIYQGLTTLVSVPATGILHTLGAIDPTILPIVASLGITGTISLAILGAITKNFVGFIYINKEATVAKISYIDFWSKRQNVEVPVDDIIPFSDAPESRMDTLYLKLKRYSSNETYKINLEHGEILNWEYIHKVLGSAK